MNVAAVCAVKRRQQLTSARLQIYLDLLSAAMFNARSLNEGGFFEETQQLLVDVESLFGQAEQVNAKAAEDDGRLEEVREEFYAVLGRARAHVTLDNITAQIYNAVFDQVRPPAWLVA